MNKLILDALNDIYKSAFKHQFWLFMAWQEIVIRYRRSLIGPFWITISTAIYVVSIAIVFSTLFNQDLEHYLVYLAIGILVWNFINQTLVEGAETFIANAGYIKQIPIEKSVFLFQSLTRNIYFFAHNVIILILCMLFFDSNINIYSVLASLGGFAILCFNLYFSILSLSCICARYMDLKQIVLSILQICFLLTPVMWIPTESMRTKAFVLEMNPFFHFIDLIRRPLLPESFPLQTIHPSINYVIVFSVVNVILGIFVFTLSRKKIAYWV